MALRARILEDHAMLRGKAGVLEALALRILRGDEDLGSALRLKGQEIQEHLVHHMGWEERELLPALHRSGGGGIADTIFAEHLKQRERIAGSLVTLQDSVRRPVAVAQHMLDFVGQLEQDMHDEEEEVLRCLITPAAASEPVAARSKGDPRSDAT